MTVEWEPMRTDECHWFAKNGGVEVADLPRGAVVQVYEVTDPELRHEATPYHWYVDVPGTDGDSDTGYSKTEREAKASALAVARDMGLVEPDKSETMVDDRTLPLFGGVE